MLAGVGLELGAVDAHQAHAQQLQLLGQKQNLQEALRHRIEVLPPEARDRIVVGVTVHRDEANPDIAVRRPLDPAAGKDSGWRSSRSAAPASSGGDTAPSPCRDGSP